jgi:hypothetical protein
MVYVGDKQISSVSFKFVMIPAGPMDKQLADRMINIQFHIYDYIITASDPLESCDNE